MLFHSLKNKITATVAYSRVHQKSKIIWGWEEEWCTQHQLSSSAKTCNLGWNFFPLTMLYLVPEQPQEGC